MSSIAVSKGAAPALAATPPRWEPSRFTRDFLGWDPFQATAPFNPWTPAAFMPSFEVKETPDEYSFKADVPGVKASDLEVTMTGNRLSIAGKRDAEKQEHTDAYYAYERAYGDFSRSFTLPSGVDANSIRADLNDGVLTVVVKKMPQTETKKISVQTATKKS